MARLGLFALLIALLASSACSTDTFSNDKEKIEDYLKDNGLWEQAEYHDGVYIIIEEPGTGEEFPTVNSTVNIHYEGYLMNGDVFDTTYDNGQVFQTKLFNTIQGWQIGIPKFKKGGKGKLLIPSTLGYGMFGRPGIPGNSILIFDIELISFF